MAGLRRWAAVVACGLMLSAMAGSARANDGGSFTAAIPPGGEVYDDGSFEQLSAGNRKIALALFDAQGGATGNDVAWTLDEIAGAKRRGTAWSEVFSRLSDEGLIDAPDLGTVITRAVGRWNARKPARAGGNGAPPVRLGAYKTLTIEDRGVVAALFRSQTIGRSGRHAWSLDQIATARQNGSRWREVFERMRADDLIRVRSLDAVLRANAESDGPSGETRKVILTNGMGRHIIVTTH